MYSSRTEITGRHTEIRSDVLADDAKRKMGRSLWQPVLCVNTATLYQYRARLNTRKSLGLEKEVEVGQGSVKVSLHTDGGLGMQI